MHRQTKPIKYTHTHTHKTKKNKQQSYARNTLQSTSHILADNIWKSASPFWKPLSTDAGVICKRHQWEKNWKIDTITWLITDNIVWSQSNGWEVTYHKVIIVYWWCMVYLLHEHLFVLFYDNLRTVIEQSMAITILLIGVAVKGLNHPPPTHTHSLSLSLPPTNKQTKIIANIQSTL